MSEITAERLDTPAHIKTVERDWAIVGGSWIYPFEINREVAQNQKHIGRPTAYLPIMFGNTERKWVLILD